MSNEHKKRENTLPFVSIVIPAFNEEKVIAKHLSSLVAQDYPKDKFEIILVDNGSTDNTREIAGRFPVEIFQQKVRSSFKARNTGAVHAKGEYIAFIDADCIAEPDWLRRLIDHAVRKQINCVAGRIENIIEKDNFANKMLQIRCSPEERKRCILDHNSVPSGNVLVKKKVFSEHGMFRPVFSGGDIDFSRRIASKGEDIGYEAKAVVGHLCDLSDLEYLHRSFRTRRGQEFLNSGCGKWDRTRKLLIDLPWKPGINRARDLSRRLGIKGTVKFLWFFAYLWLDRFFAYFGAISGTIIRKQDHEKI